jgi:tricorn protease
MRRVLGVAMFLAILSVSPRPSHCLSAQPDTTDTRLLHSPTISKDHIAFVYGDDLWISDLDGKNVRQLTSDPGVEWNPAFSPDGRTLAFTGQYNDYGDVYTVLVGGGKPTRLTWHPGQDFVCSWTLDG